MQKIKILKALLFLLFFKWLVSARPFKAPCNLKLFTKNPLKTAPFLAFPHSFFDPYFCNLIHSVTPTTARPVSLPVLACSPLLRSLLVPALLNGVSWKAALAGFLSTTLQNYKLTMGLLDFSGRPTFLCLSSSKRPSHLQKGVRMHLLRLEETLWRIYKKAR